MGTENKLIDVHTHLEQYTQEELAAVLKNARKAKVGWIVTSGMDLETSTSAVEIASAHERVLASVGIHPWVAAEGLSIDYEKLSALSKKSAVVAIGEIGLDFIDNVFKGVTYHDNRELQENQRITFRKCVDLACESKLPVIVHARGAYQATISMLKERNAQTVGGVIHNFEGDEKQAQELLDMDFFLSFGGDITYPEAHALRETLRTIPLSGILTETDSPYMPLYQQSADKNEPANINQIVKIIAALKRVEQEELIEIVHSNFRALFKRP